MKKFKDLKMYMDFVIWGDLYLNFPEPRLCFCKKIGKNKFKINGSLDVFFVLDENICVLDDSWKPW